MKKYIAFVFALVYVLSLVGCAGKSDGTTSSEHKSFEFEKGESSENTNGFGPFIQWYDTNDSLIESISVMGEQTIIHDGFFWTATDGNIDAELLESAAGDLIIINYDYANGEAEESSLKTGDIIAITYSTFEKSDAVYEITPGQIHLMDLGFFGIY